MNVIEFTVAWTGVPELKMLPRMVRKKAEPRGWAQICRDRLVLCLNQAAECFPLGGPSPEQVHASRRCLKESRALALLLAEAAGAQGRDGLETLDTLRRRTGAMRDEFVMRGILATLSPWLDPKFSDDLAERIGRHARRIVGLTSVAVESRATLSALAGDVSRWPTGRAAGSAVVRGLRRSYRAGRRRGRIAFATRTVGDVHYLRKAVIDYRYQLASLAEAWPALFAAWIGEAEYLRKRLGKHHDLGLLAEFAAAEYADLSEWSQLAEVVARRQAALLPKAQASYYRLFSLRPTSFERQVRAVLEHPVRPQKQRVSARRGSSAREAAKPQSVH